MSTLGSYLCIFTCVCVYICVCVCARVCICVCVFVTEGKRETFFHIRFLIYCLLRSFPTGCVVFLAEFTISCTVISASATCSKKP